MVNGMSRKLRWALLALAAVGLVLAGSGSVLAQDAVKLMVTDCVKCHDTQPAEIAAKGLSHRDKINCQDCHTGHRPKVANNIPQCSNCHGGQPHYELEDCLRCHNPHTPRDVTFKGELKKECFTCHADKGEEMTAFPSKHALKACNFCHPNKHKVIPECTQCHKSHSDQITAKDCTTCHQPHQPLTLAYSPKTPSNFCAACHGPILNQLRASNVKHATFECVFCHQNKHKTVPLCSDCHGKPHPEAIHQRFPKCGECHNIAHELNAFKAKKEEAKPAKKDAKTEKKGK